MIKNYSDWNLNEAKATKIVTQYQGNVMTFEFKRDKVDVFRKYHRHAKVNWFQIDNAGRFKQTDYFFNQDEDFVIRTINKVLEYQTKPSTPPADGEPGTYNNVMLSVWKAEHNLPEILASDPRLKKWWESASRNKKFGI